MLLGPGRTQTGWKEIALRKVQNTAEETKEAFPDAYEIIETAPEGTRVTDLLDVSGMLIRGGKGTGKLLSFKNVVLAGGFTARKSRIAVDVSFNVGRYICLPRLVVCMDGARMLACPCCKLPPVMPPPSSRSFTGRGRGGGLASAPRHAFDAVPAARQRT